MLASVDVDNNANTNRKVKGCCQNITWAKLGITVEPFGFLFVTATFMQVQVQQEFKKTML